MEVLDKVLGPQFVVFRQACARCSDGEQELHPKVRNVIEDVPVKKDVFVFLRQNCTAIIGIPYT
jgi:hypothetical protein